MKRGRSQRQQRSILAQGLTSLGVLYFPMAHLPCHHLYSWLSVPWKSKGPPQQVCFLVHQGLQEVDWDICRPPPQQSRPGVSHGVKWDKRCRTRASAVPEVHQFPSKVHLYYLLSFLENSPFTLCTFFFSLEDFSQWSLVLEFFSYNRS